MKALLMLLAANGALAFGLLWLGQTPATEALPARAERDLPALATPLPASSPVADNNINIVRVAKLFGPSRIAAGAEAPPQVQPEPAEALAAPAPILELVGILLGDANRVALIRFGEPPEVRRVTLGSAVGKWQIVRIDMRSVILREGVEEIEIKLDTASAK